MKNLLDWKAVGRLISFFVDVCTIIRATWKEMKIGIEILEWILSNEGKKYFVEKCLTPMGKEFLATQRVRVIDDNTIEVNLSISPKLPFEGATVEWHHGEGWVQVQKRQDGLYVGDKKVVLYLSERQESGKTIQGHELRQALTGKPVLTANIMDALLAHPYLIPQDWMKDGKGNTIYIYFWGTGYRYGGRLSVRCFRWGGGRWYSHCVYLDVRWDAHSPAVSLTS